MLALLIFSALLAGLVFVLEPNGLLCATTLSSGLISAPPHPLFALSLIPLFMALRSRIGGFVLLAPSIVSAAMAPETALLSLVGAGVLALSRFRAYLPFVLLSAYLALALLVGLPLATLALFALFVPLTGLIDHDVWRIRALFAWFALSLVIVVIFSRYDGSFPLELIGISMTLPIEPIVFVGLTVMSALSLVNDSNAAISRGLVLFGSTMFFPHLALFAMPLIAGMLASSIAQRLPEERLKGSRILALAIVAAALVVTLPTASETVDVERGIVFTSDYVELTCEGRTYPERIDRSGTLERIHGTRSPSALDTLIEQENVTAVVYSAGSDAPIVYAVEHSDVLGIEERDDVIIASIS